MNIYHFIAETGEYIGQGQADADPLEAGKFLIPANATVTAPPSSVSGQVAVFNGEAWALTPDHRGETWFDSDGAEVEVDFIGDPSLHGFLDEKPVIPETPPTPEELSSCTAKKSWETRVSGPMINGVRIKCDADAIGLINGMAMLAQQDATRRFNFDTGDGVLIFTASEAIALAEQVGEFVQLTFDRRADVYAAINNGTVTTTAEIDAAFIDVTDNWPEG